MDNTIGYEQAGEAARLALGRGERALAEDTLRSAVEAAEREGGSDAHLANLLAQYAELRRPFDEGEADRLLARALDHATRAHGEEHPDLVVLLGEVSRAHLRRGDHAAAEPLLLRLLAIKRLKGEEHPEVATVLASLATVRQALGRYEDAEQLWRRVLAIRERTLAPNHFATATALEHLGDACAARGKLVEAVTLRRRALAMRTATLDALDPGVRVARERLADLEMQAAEGGDIGGVAPAREAALLALPAPMLAPVAPPRASLPPLPPVAPPAPPAAPVALVASAAPATQVPAPQAMARPASVVVPQASGGISLEALRQLEAELEAEEPPVPPMDRARAAFAAAFAWGMTHPVHVGGAIGVAVVVLLVSSLASAREPSYGEAGAEELPAPRAAAARPAVADAGTAPSYGVAPAAVRPAGEVGAARAASFDGALDTPQASHVPATPARAEESRPARRDEEAASPARLPQLRAPAVGALAISAPTVGGKSSDAALANMAGFVAGRADVGTERATGTLAPRLVQPSPAAGYPPQLREQHMSGTVRVSFMVDTLGRAEAATFVVLESPHPLFTASVRRLLPDLRFLPATENGRRVRGRMTMPFVFSAQ